MPKWLEPIPSDEVMDAIAEAREAGRREILALVAKLPSPWECVTAGASPQKEGGMLPPLWHCWCRWCSEKATVTQWKHPVSEGHPDNGCLWSLATRPLTETGKEQA